MTCLLCRSMHYPPETSSIMLMAKMVAIVKQVSVFVWLLVQIITSCVSITPWKSQQCNSKLLMETPKFKKKTLKSFYAFFFFTWGGFQTCPYRGQKCHGNTFFWHLRYADRVVWDVISSLQHYAFMKEETESFWTSNQREKNIPTSLDSKETTGRDLTRITTSHCSCTLLKF